MGVGVGYVSVGVCVMLRGSGRVWELVLSSDVGVMLDKGAEKRRRRSTRTPHRSHGSRTDLHFSTPRGAWAIFDRICSGRPSWTPGAPAVAVIAARASRRESRMAVQCFKVRGQKKDLISN